jgi:hypothetical protein
MLSWLKWCEMPQLWEVLGKKPPVQKKSAKKKKRTADKTESAEAPQKVEHVPEERHTVLELKDAKKLFVDLPKKHRFWLKTGQDISNLMELYKELLEMDEDIFRHHVSHHRNDFAAWVHEVYKDHALSGRLLRSLTRPEHIRILHEYIESMKKPLAKAKKKSNIRPDLSFLRKSFDKPDIQPELETKRRIRPAALRPNYAFIQKERTETKQIESELNAVDAQVIEMKQELATVREEIREAKTKHHRPMLIDNIKQLKAEERVLSEELAALKSEETALGERYRLLAHKEYRIVRAESAFGKMDSGSVIADKLSHARKLVAGRKYEEARKAVTELRKAISSIELPKQEKKKAYYAMLELATDIDSALSK